jgi:hypothetical protein
MIHWIDYDKKKPPKFVIFVADFGEYQEKLILDRKGLWSEETQNYIKETPIRWRVK